MQQSHVGIRSLHYLKKKIHELNHLNLILKITAANVTRESVPNPLDFKRIGL